MRSPKLTLVGAGPGDADLITVRGLRALETADIVLYDALVSPALLHLIPASTPVMFVGKRKGRQEFTQGEINDLVINLATKYQNIVRLKGGDPFVFGRGFEELERARSRGLATEYIPGLTSAVAVPGLQGIPVTHRGTSDSFWVITAVTSEGTLSDAVSFAAKTDATVIILMGLGQLREIAEVFAAAGKGGLAVAIIQNGTQPEERTILGTVGTIVEVAEASNIGTPAIIVLGETVTLHPGFLQAVKERESVLKG